MAPSCSLGAAWLARCERFSTADSEGPASCLAATFFARLGLALVTGCGDHTAWLGRTASSTDPLNSYSMRVATQANRRHSAQEGSRLASSDAFAGAPEDGETRVPAGFGKKTAGAGAGGARNPPGSEFLASGFLVPAPLDESSIDSATTALAGCPPLPAIRCRTALRAQQADVVLWPAIFAVAASKSADRSEDIDRDAENEVAAGGGNVLWLTLDHLLQEGLHAVDDGFDDLSQLRNVFDLYLQRQRSRVSTPPSSLHVCWGPATQMRQDISVVSADLILLVSRLRNVQGHDVGHDVIVVWADDVVNGFLDFLRYEVSGAWTALHPQAAARQLAFGKLQSRDRCTAGQRPTSRL